MRQKSALPDLHSHMSNQTKHELVARLRRRCATAGPQSNSQRLDQAVQRLGYHRKAAIRALRAKPSGQRPAGLHLVVGRRSSLGMFC